MKCKELPFRDVATCPHCLLRQFIRSDKICRRCLQPLGITYYEFSLLNPHSGSSGVRITRQTVGTMIRELRQKQGMTQVALAARLATHRTHLSRIERGRMLPRGDLLLRCIEILGADKIILRIRDRSPEASALSNDIPLPSEGRF